MVEISVKVCDMFKIGDFAVISQIPSSQLRYYDEIGLFEPSHIDSQNGYRYYKLEQLADLNRIMALKNLGLSLDEVQHLLKNHVSNNNIRQMLEAKREEIKQRLEEEQTRLRQVEARLQLLEQGYTPTTQPVIIKPVPAQTYLAFKQVSMDHESFVNDFSHRYNRIHEIDLPEKNYAVCIAHNAGFEPDGLHWELGFYVGQNAPQSIPFDESFCLKCYELPAVETMASIIHVGSLATGGLAYAALSQWIAFNQYEITGAFREIFLVLGAPLDISDSMVMEVQVPIKIR